MRKAEQKPDLFHEADGGFTSFGVVVALSLALTLIFTSAQVYWLNSRAADVQFAADAGALAASNVVAEFQTLVQVSDAAVLSLSLFAITVEGVGIVVSCIPGANGIGVEITDFAQQLFRARDELARQAGQALNGLQRLLPFLAALRAAEVVLANGHAMDGADFLGIALLVPWEGTDISIPDVDAAEQAARDVEEANRETAQSSAAAEAAREEMQQERERAWRADCGDSPGRCLYEPAGKLASMSGLTNPYFSSPEVWSFSYALNRARDYYRQRLTIEKPANSSLAEAVRSRARSIYYDYAIELMAQGYVHESPDGSFDAYFPLLPHNRDELRASPLYRRALFYADSRGYLHAVDSCPNYLASGSAGLGSLANLEAGIYQSCDVCGLSIDTLAQVGSATTNTDSGFEYHYRIIAACAECYEQAAREAQQAEQAARSDAEAALDLYEIALAALATPRLEAHPPGSNGCIVFVIDRQSHSAPGGFGSSLAGGQTQLGPRMAISAATLVADPAGDGGDMLSSLFDGLAADARSGSPEGTLFSVIDGLMGLWGTCLKVYNSGVDGLGNAVASLIGAIPLVNRTALASWARNAVVDTLEGLGLQSADLSTYKPLLVNSIYVLHQSELPPLHVLTSAKDAYRSYGQNGNDLLGGDVFAGLLGELGDHVEVALGSEFTLFTISFGDIRGLPEIPIRVQLPQGLIDQVRGQFDELASWLSANLGSGRREDVWW